MTCNLEDPPLPGTLIDELKRLINDNYTLIVIYIILLSLFLYALYYVGSDLSGIVKDYLKMSKMEVEPVKKSDPSVKNSGNQKDTSADNDYYPDVNDESAPQNPGTVDTKKPKDYRTKEELSFFNKLNITYNEYNSQKSQYISQVYQGRNNDDIVDDNIEYSKYDDYDYTIK